MLCIIHLHLLRYIIKIIEEDTNRQFKHEYKSYYRHYCALYLNRLSGMLLAHLIVYTD